MITVYFFRYKFTKQVDYQYISKCEKCHGTLQNDTITFLNIGWIVIGVFFCIVLCSNTRSSQNYKDLTCKVKAVRAVIQVLALLIMGGIVIMFIKIKPLKAYATNQYFQIVYSIIFGVIIVFGYYGIPSMLKCIKYDVKEDWIFEDSDESKDLEQ